MYKVIRAKKEFYDRNPSGRILNRFSSDLGDADDTLIQISMDIFHIWALCTAIIITICFISPILIVACVIILVFYVKIALNFKEPIKRIK